MSAAVGADVESMCNKCGDVWHVVVAKVGETIAKVQCKECGAYHKHRPPGGKKRKSTGKTTRKRKSKATASADVVATPVIAADMSRPVRDYNFRETFEAGERIEHPKFGLGIVQGSPAPGKIDVAFPTGPRLLAQAKPDMKLEARRVTFDD